MQRIIISGHVGRDSEITSFGERQRLVFTVACSEGKGDQKTTTWYDVEYHGTGLQPYVVKGKQIIVMGRFRVKAYNAKDGTQRIGINVYADTVELVGGGGQQSAQYPQQQAPQPQTQVAPQPQVQASQDDGLPF